MANFSSFVSSLSVLVQRGVDILKNVSTNGTSPSSSQSPSPGAHTENSPSVTATPNELNITSLQQTMADIQTSIADAVLSVGIPKDWASILTYIGEGISGWISIIIGVALLLLLPLLLRCCLSIIMVTVTLFRVVVGLIGWICGWLSIILVIPLRVVGFIGRIVVTLMKICSKLGKGLFTSLLQRAQGILVAIFPFIISAVVCLEIRIYLVAVAQVVLLLGTNVILTPLQSIIYASSSSSSSSSSSILVDRASVESVTQDFFCIDIFRPYEGGDSDVMRTCSLRIWPLEISAMFVTDGGGSEIIAILYNCLNLVVYTLVYILTFSGLSTIILPQPNVDSAIATNGKSTFNATSDFDFNCLLDQSRNGIAEISDFLLWNKTWSTGIIQGDDDVMVRVSGIGHDDVVASSSLIFVQQSLPSSNLYQVVLDSAPPSARIPMTFMYILALAYLGVKLFNLLCIYGYTFSKTFLRILLLLIVIIPLDVISVFFKLLGLLPSSFKFFSWLWNEASNHPLWKRLFQKNVTNNNNAGELDDARSRRKRELDECVQTDLNVFIRRFKFLIDHSYVLSTAASESTTSVGVERPSQQTVTEEVFYFVFGSVLQPFYGIPSDLLFLGKVSSTLFGMTGAIPMGFSLLFHLVSRQWANSSYSSSDNNQQTSHLSPHHHQQQQLHVSVFVGVVAFAIGCIGIGCLYLGNALGTCVYFLSRMDLVEILCIIRRKSSLLGVQGIACMIGLLSLSLGFAYLEVIFMHLNSVHTPFPFMSVFCQFLAVWTTILLAVYILSMLLTSLLSPSAGVKVVKVVEAAETNGSAVGNVAIQCIDFGILSFLQKNLFPSVISLRKAILKLLLDDHPIITINVCILLFIIDVCFNSGFCIASCWAGLWALMKATYFSSSIQEYMTGDVLHTNPVVALLLWVHVSIWIHFFNTQSYTNTSKVGGKSADAGDVAANVNPSLFSGSGSAGASVLQPAHPHKVE